MTRLNMSKKSAKSKIIFAIVLGLACVGIIIGVILIKNREWISFLHDKETNSVFINDELVEQNVILESISEVDLAYDVSNEEELYGRSDIVVIGQVKNIDGAINYDAKNNEYFMTSTIGEVKVKNIIKNNGMTEKNNWIKFIRLGGTISIAEYEKGLSERQIQRQGLDKLSQAEKDTSYVKVAIAEDIEIQRNKTYLMYMVYDYDLDRYEIIGMQYGLREYNEKTKQVKNNNTGHWEKGRRN